MVANVAARKSYGVLMTAPMRGYVRIVVAALVAAALLFAPTASASATCAHAAGDAASLALAIAHIHASSAQANCGDHSAPHPRSANHGARCAATCAPPEVTNVQAPAAHCANASIPLIVSLDAFAAGLSIPPLLGPPRT